jgi:hypothetical protein
MNVNMIELRRMVTNLDGDDKVCLNNAVRAINMLIAENNKLRAEVEQLKVEGKVTD